MAHSPLQLPVRGSWFVFWGGDTKKLNYHHDDQAEKYALDLIILDESGKSFKKSGTKNEDYFAFGQDILAPADGEIIEAVDGHKDNIPNKTVNNYAYGGNYVLIKHSDNLYSSLQHFRQGSIKVKADQLVKSGQKLGECGNSGNSTEPHLHFHLQDSNTFTVLTKDYERRPLAKGIKPYFTNLQGNKEPYSPIKGDVLISIKEKEQP